VDILRDAIVSGQLRPDEHLKETTIAAQLSVSRSPVREAFRQLEQEGLIVSIPNQGSFVKSFDEQDIREIFTLRAVLEDLACEIVLKENGLQPADLAQLENYVEQQRAAIKAEDFNTLTSLDMQFHEFICRKSGFARLLKMWQGLRAQIQVLFYQRFLALDEVPETVDTDHSLIMKALREGDLEQFSQVNREINERVAEECIQVIRTMQAETDI
jgi:DNA-binding GntR family transcriptional regulator